MIRFPKIGARLSLAVILAALLIVPFGGVLHAQDPRCPLGGYIDETTGPGCAMSITMNIAYPTWLADSPAMETAVGDLINSIRTGFLTDLDASFGEYFSGGYLGISYEEYEHGAPLRSVVFTVDTYTGGAHGNSFFQSVTVDTLADRVLTLDGDVFQPGSDAIGVLQPLVVAALQEQLGEDADLEWINGGTDELADYTAWAINAGSLELFFPPYQIAPYAFGSFQVTVPLDSLYPAVNPMLIP